MPSVHLAEGRSFVALVVLASLALAAIVPARAAGEFPFGEELLLDTSPMRPGKRMPSITVERSGNAMLDLWCKSVAGRVEVGEGTIRIAAELLPEQLPAMQGSGQCTPERIRADEGLLAALTQATSWRAAGRTVVLDGAAPMKFRQATN